MKIAIMSDVHANPAALKTALQDAKKRGANKYILLGDVVGYGYDPNGSIKLAEKNFDVILKGNHDAGLIGELSLDWFNMTARDGVLRHRGIVNEENKEFLKSLPYTYTNVEYNFIATHGTVFFPEKFEYLDDPFTIGLEVETIAKSGLNGHKYNIIFCGHTHIPRTVIFDDHANMKEFVRESKFYVSPDEYYVVNVGSVGYPRAERYITYSLYDTEESSIELIKLPYDFKGYVEHLEANDIPVPLWLEAHMDSMEYNNGK